jgi:hypothetical protein
LVDDLTLYLRAATGEAFDWPWRNCMIWVADWIVSQTAHDPAAAWRSGEFDPARIDVLALARETMADFQTTQSPKRGDVGIVLTGLRGEATAAICTGSRWAALAPQGLAVAAWPCVMAWTI